MEDGAIVHVYDPQVLREDAIREFEDHGMQVKHEKFIFTKTAEEAADGAHAIVMLTEWDEFKRYNYMNFYDKMLKPAFLFDGRNMLDHAELERIGYEVHTLGKAKVLATTQPRGLSDVNLSATG
jgi:UDPglucose 6-dehydrogenase